MSLSEGSPAKTPSESSTCDDSVETSGWFVRPGIRKLNQAGVLTLPEIDRSILLEVLCVWCAKALFAAE